MYRNFLEAKRYFSKWRLKDLFDAINKISTDTYPYPQQWGTWESGFFASIFDGSSSLAKLREAFTLAGLTGETLDNDYIAHSADKHISMVLAQRIAKEFGKGNSIIDFDPFHPLQEASPTETYQLVLAMLTELESHYGANLLSIAKAYFDSDYNPIENYSMVQVETPDITHTKSGTSSETETPNITETIHTEANSKLQTDGASSGNVFGFGSSASTPLNEGESSQTTQGSKDDNYTDSERRETGTRSVSGSSGETEKETGTRRLTRSGNIGVTTSQQMLQSEIDLRKFDFLEEVFKCFDKVICASVY